MIKKIGALLEEHVEKIVLILVGLLCAWIFVTRILFSPNMVEYDVDKTEKISPGAIDERLYEDAMKLKNERIPIEEPVKLPLQKPEYTSLLESSLSDINTDISFLFPGVRKKIDGPSPYKQPVIGRVTDVDIEYIRAAAYMPTSVITRDNLYEDGNSEPNDLDLITVEAEFDIAALYDELYKCFEYNVSDESLADSSKTEPIFASVNLQRQQWNESGFWSDWQNVEQPKINHNRDLFKVIESPSDLPMGGFAVYKFRLDNIEAQIELLQPQAYQIASEYEEWLPPKLHREYLDAKRQEDRQRREEEREQERENRDNERNSRRGRNDNTAGILGGGGTAVSTLGGVGSRRGSGTTNLTTSGGRRGRGITQPDPVVSAGGIDEEESPIEDVYDKFEDILLTVDTDLSRVDEPVLFWAHDDTVEPGGTYRYKIRLGILNPVAEEYGGDIILWSDFSDITDSVEIPERIYFTATNVQEAAKTVTVSVYKFLLGYWYKDEFKVAQGEMIGDVKELEPEDDSDDEDTRITDDEEPIIIDYRTGAVMVDVDLAAYEWTGTRSLSYKPYRDMMYSYDGMDIMHLPVTRNLGDLPQELGEAIVDVQRFMSEHEQEPLKSWGSNERQIQQIRDGMNMGIFQ